MILSSTEINTPIGKMITIAGGQGLYLLEFTQRKNLSKNISKLESEIKYSVAPNRSPVLDQISDELTHYFSGELKHFQTPFHLRGTPFQQRVWQQLKKIPHGKTISYAELAQKLNQPTAYRAVAGANSKNQLAILIPCHRVINSNGQLGGYAGGLTRKQWLFQHEL